MASLQDARFLGGIGSILLLMIAVPNVGWVLAIIGFILTLIAIKYISDIVGDKEIYRNTIISVITGIAAIAVAAATVIGGVLTLIGMGSFVNSTFELSPNVRPGDIFALIAAIIPGLVAVWVLLIISAYFLRMSLSSISDRLNVKLFDTTGLLYLIGATTAVVVIGFALLFVAEILLVISFFLIQEESRQPRQAEAA